eukprot:scaffold43000_cov71-Cyclotella_meneghiniana.AAC.5
MTSQHDESDATHQRSNSDYYKKGSQEEATESAVTLAKIQHRKIVLKNMLDSHDSCVLLLSVRGPDILDVLLLVLA